MKTLLMSSKSGGKAPHCKVCGDESSGFHYGVDSCEGCKGFFRRCITQGMNHKCANEEKCEITPFTRNSCQYCRLKKCFEVGMSREASRLGRRPKRLKEVGGEGSGGARSHVGNVPIAPYPSQQELYRMRMAELQKILQNNGTFKEELMQAFLSAAKASFQEHSKSGGGGGADECPSQRRSTANQKQQMVNTTGMSSLEHNVASVSGLMHVSSSTTETTGVSTDSLGIGSGLSGVDSPSSLHSPGGTAIDLNMAALDNFLLEQGLPSTPGGLDAVAELQALNSPFNLNNVSLDPVSNANSPLPDLGVGSPLLPSSTPNGGGSTLNEPLSHGRMNNTNLLNQNVNAPSTSGTAAPQLQPATCLQQYQQYQQQQQQLMASSSAMSCMNSVHVKAEPSSDYSAHLSVKIEPVSPEPMATSTTPAPGSLLMSPMTTPRYCTTGSADTNVAAIMEEVRQVPSETRRLLIEQVTDAVVEAHLSTTFNTYKAVEEANKRLNGSSTNENIPDMSKLTLDADTMWQRFVSAMVPEITKVVKFCKKLPGFSEIEQDDQIRLIKQGSFEVMVTRFSMLVDHDNQTMMDPTLSMRSPRDVIREMPMGEFLDEFFFVASQFNPLKLTDGEVGLFTSILIICPARKSLRNVRAISKIQSLFQQALYFLMKHNHADPDAKFSQLMSLISTFHRINEEHFRALSNIRMKSPEDFGNKFPELHREIFDSSSLEQDQ